MSIVTKVLKISAEKTFKGSSGKGYPPVNLFPSGTRRFVKKVYLLPKNILGEKVYGGVILEQKASVNKIDDKNHPVHYNTWENVRVVGPYSYYQERRLKFD